MLIKKLLKILGLLKDNKTSDENNTLKCPKCKNDEWFEGPGGGSFGNIICANCGKKYNNLGPFGLQEIESN